MSRPDSIGRRAAFRLFFSLGLLVVLIALGSLGLYEAALRKAAHKRAEELAAFYATRLTQIEREWEVRSRDVKVRIEATRAFERPANAAVELQAFLTIQDTDRPFQYLLIQAEDGRKLFDFGKDINLPAIPASGALPFGHYLDPKDGQVYRVFQYPIWLGAARGSGSFAAFFRIDNALLSQLRTPDLTLGVSYAGTMLASSDGSAVIGRQVRPDSAAATGKETRQLSWTGKPDDPLRLHIEAPVTALFSAAELAAGVSVIPLIDGLVLWLTLGLWLMRQTRRVSELGDAVGEYAAARQVTPAMRTRLGKAGAGRNDEIGLVANAIESLAADIDRRERERESAFAQLHASETEYRTILNTTVDGFWIVSVVEGRMLDVNATACAMLDYTREELLAMRISDLEATEQPEETRQHIADIMAGRRERFESRHRRKDGSIVDVEIACKYVAVRGGALVVFVRDISARKQAEAALQAAKAEAERANSTKTAFLANISHEIRTPLHVITGLGHLLRRDVSDHAELERLNQLCSTSEHLLAIVNDILDLTKIEAGQLTLDRSGFRLDSVVNKVVSMIEAQAREKGLALTVEVQPQLHGLALAGDALRLAQVLINLCSNAVKFTDKGMVRLRVSCPANAAGGVTLRFAVEDSGIGIPAAEQARLFRPFTQADASSTRERGGTGLGLAISQRLVGLMGSTIEVDSRVGQGSVFSFELRLPHATGGPAKPAATMPSAGSFQGSRVLFAEDHRLSQEILFEMLEDLGCEVEVASDGAEALACAEERTYDLILMDMQMPRMDGLAATRAIRALPEHRDTPIIALTANAFADDRQRCLDAGMNDHLGKPVTPATLATALSQWLPQLAVPDDEAPVCDNDLSRAIDRIPGLEVGRAWRRSTEHLEGYRSQLDRFTQLHVDDMARLRACLAAADRHQAHVVAHNLKGIAGLISARRVAALASDIVQDLRAGADDARIEALAEACEAELAGLAAAVRALPPPATAFTLPG